MNGGYRMVNGELMQSDFLGNFVIMGKLDYLTENYEALKTGKKIRAVFKEEKGRLVLMVLRVGLRKGIY